MFSRQDLASFYEGAHHKTGWSAAWGQAVEGLTPAQAAWKPAPDRHSIWQIANHISFWREEVLRRASGQPKAGEDVVAKENWRGPDEVTDRAWAAARERFRASHEAIAKSALDDRAPLDGILNLMGHDFYHVGQIMFLRAMQGMPAIE